MPLLGNNNLLQYKKLRQIVTLGFWLWMVLIMFWHVLVSGSCWQKPLICFRSWTSYTRYPTACPSPPTTSGILMTCSRRCGTTSVLPECTYVFISPFVMPQPYLSTSLPPDPLLTTTGHDPLNSGLSTLVSLYAGVLNERLQWPFGSLLWPLAATKVS